MTIIHIAAGLQETCGVSQYVVNTARAQQSAGHDVTIVTSMTCGFPVDDLHVVLAPDPVPYLTSHYAKLASHLNIVVHIHSMWNLYIHRAAAWCQKNGVPYVASPHGSATPWAMHYKWWKKKLAWWLYQRKDFGHAAAFHATVPSEEADVRRLGFTQSVVIAPLGADIPHGEGHRPPSSVPLASSPRDVVFISRIHPKKNLPTLVRAWSILRRKRVSARLVIAGSDDVGHQAELVALVQAQGLRAVDFSRDLEYGKKTVFGGGEVPLASFQKRLADCDADVVFTGPVYSRAKDWMFAHAWVSVLPSHSENFGGVVVESLAQGTPVIASKGTPWQELEGDAEIGRCGWWVEATPEQVAETMVSALSLSLEQRLKMSIAARKLVETRYSWRSSAQNVLNCYQQVLRNQSEKLV